MLKNLEPKLNKKPRAKAKKKLSQCLTKNLELHKKPRAKAKEKRPTVKPKLNKKPRANPKQKLRAKAEQKT